MKTKLVNIAKKFKDTSILIIGDLIIDEYIIGKVSRISPEAPVPVVHVNKQKYLPGGAANVAENVAALGGKPHLIGIIGTDYFGEVMRQKLKKLKINTKYIIPDKSRSTILKSRIIANNQQVVRVDYEEIKKISAKVSGQIIMNIKKIIKKMDTVVISDYGKGVITKKLIREIVELCKTNNKKIIVDPYTENFEHYKNVAIMTPNKAEAAKGIGNKIKNEKSLIKTGKEIVEKLNLEALLITRSEEGMTLFKKNKIYNIPTKATEVYDVTGAGDTVVSVLALALGSGSDFLHSSIISNFAGGEVIKELGSVTINCERLIKAIKNGDISYDKV